MGRWTCVEHERFLHGKYNSGDLRYLFESDTFHSATQ